MNMPFSFPNSLSGKTVAGLSLFAIALSLLVWPVAALEAAEGVACQAHKTVWSEAVEACFEVPTLIKRKPATVEMILTDLSNHKPLTKGRPFFLLAAENGAPIRVELRKGTRPGSFQASIVPMQSGRHTLSLEVVFDHGKETLPCGTAEVVEQAPEKPAAHPAHAEPEAGIILFPKEQQWAVEFEVRPPAIRGISPKTLVPGELVPVSNAECVVTIPLAGVVSHEFPIPYIGQHVKKGQVVAHIEPPLQQEGGADQLVVTLAEAESRVLLAQKEFDRAKRLYEAKAAPRKRLEEAEIMLDVARTALAPLEKSMGQLQKGDCLHMIVKAPITGTVTEINAPNGSMVQPGQPLLRIINPDRLWLKANVPAAIIGHMEDFSQAYFTVAGFERRFKPSRLVTVSDLVDPKTRTIPVLFEVPNPDHGLKVGMFVNVFLAQTSNTTTALAITETGVFEDEGRFFVYVQVSGTEFRRREVTLGSRDDGYVQILEGIGERDRIVTKGGYYVKQASQISGKAPVDAHGHQH